MAKNIINNGDSALQIRNNLNSNFTELYDFQTQNSSIYTIFNLNSANYILAGGNTKNSNLSIGTTDNYNLSLKTNNMDKVVITSEGYVGVGIPSPNEALTVFGNICATGMVYGGIANKLEDFIIVCSDETTSLTVTTSATTFRVPFQMHLNSVRASVNVAPVGSTIIIDVKQNNSSIFSTNLSINETEKTSTTADVPAVISTNTLIDDAEITVDIMQVGSTTAGAGLKLTFKGYRI